MTSQDQFEAWASEHLPTLYLTKTDQGTYESTATGNFFAVWSARDGEIEQLRAIFARPHNLKAKAADDYETLKKQFNALKTYAACQEKMRDHYRDAAEKLSKLDRSQSADEINAERSVNEQLTNDLLLAEDERDQLKAENEALRKDAQEALAGQIHLCNARDLLKATVSDYEMGLEAAREEIARLKADLAAELQRRWDGNEASAREHDEEVRKLKENEALRKALTDIFNHIEGNTECLVRDLVNWGTPRINPNDFYDECEAIKEIASAAMSKEASHG